MKALKVILIIVALIVAIPLIIALFINNDYNIEREITINQPKEKVFDYVKYLRNQEHYSKWVQLDPNMKKEFRGQDGTVGFVYAWDGNDEAGKGEQEIKDIKEGEKVDVEVRFEKPFKNTAYAPISTEAISTNETKVRWAFKGRNKYPLNFMNLFMGNILGKDIDNSLHQLKGVLEHS